jgi:hypothetical protein
MDGLVAPLIFRTLFGGEHPDVALQQCLLDRALSPGKEAEPAEDLP